MGDQQDFQKGKEFRVWLGAAFYKLVANLPSSFVSFLPRNAILSQNICNLLDWKIRKFLEIRPSHPEGPPWLGQHTGLRSWLGLRPVATGHHSIRELGQRRVDGTFLPLPTNLPTSHTDHICTHRHTHDMDTHTDIPEHKHSQTQGSLIGPLLLQGNCVPYLGAFPHSVPEACQAGDVICFINDKTMRAQRG